MNYLAISLLTLSLVSAKSVSNTSEEDDAFMRVPVMSCLVENWRGDRSAGTNNLRVGNCLKCLHQIEDVPSAAKCISTYMPTTHSSCEPQLADLQLGVIESENAIVDCMRVTLQYMVSTYCLNQTQASSPLEKLTDGAMCHLEVGNYANNFYLQTLENQDDNEGDFMKDYDKDNHYNETSDYEEEDEEDSELTVLSMAFCDIGANTDQNRLNDCKACFKTNTDVKGGAECSVQYLLPHFQECDEGLAELAGADDPSQEVVETTMKCLKRILVRDVVAQCSGTATEASEEALVYTMACGKIAADNWLKTNARKEIMEDFEINFIN